MSADRQCLHGRLSASAWTGSVRADAVMGPRRCTLVSSAWTAVSARMDFYRRGCVKTSLRGIARPQG
jgi:hypothetical protein